MTVDSRPTGLVLAGAAALGAYQIGVLSHLVSRVADDLGAPLAFDVLSGTSAGGINVAAMASGADDPIGAVARLERAWTELRLEQMLRPSTLELLALVTDLAGGPARLRRALRAQGAHGGLIDPRPVARLCDAAVEPARITANLRAGRMRAVALAATQVATGRAVVFYQAGVAPRARAGATMAAAALTPGHALASAAVPLLFPAVNVGGELYCDGGLRQMVPLSPALHLGARRVVLVSSVARAELGDVLADARREAVTSPLYLAGKALDALFTDGVEGDLDRLQQVNRMLAAGTRRFGATFAADLDGELAALGAPPVRPVDVVHVQPSRDLGVLATEYVASPAFAARARGAAAYAVRCLAGSDAVRAGGVLAYLLFDGGFAAELIALGRADARAQHDALVELLDPRCARLASVSD